MVSERNYSGARKKFHFGAIFQKIGYLAYPKTDSCGRVLIELVSVVEMGRTDNWNDNGDDHWIFVCFKILGLVVGPQQAI